MFLGTVDFLPYGTVNATHGKFCTNFWSFRSLKLVFVSFRLRAVCFFPKKEEEKSKNWWKETRKRLLSHFGLVLLIRQV
jgi:hypothetical protein